jgi:hypothetical protein
MKDRYVPLKDWSCPSYDPKTGKQASVFAPPGTAVTLDGTRIAPSAQRYAGDTRGVHGAPGWGEWQRQHDAVGKK